MPGRGLPRIALRSIRATRPRIEASVSVMKSFPPPRSKPSCAAAPRERHPGARRRHGHGNPGAQARRGRLSRHALRRLAERPARQQRHSDPVAAGRGARNCISTISAPAPTSFPPTRSPRPASPRPTTARRTLVPELNLAGARLAKEAAAIAAREDGRPRFVAGAIGPTNRTASISPDVSNPGFRAISFDELREAYGEQARGPPRRRRRHPAARDRVRHPQRQGGALRDRGTVRGARRVRSR